VSVTVRRATDADFAAVSRFDLTYPANRYLHFERAGHAPEHRFSLRWREQDAPDENYATYSVERLQGAVTRADLFVVAEVDGRSAGLLMILLPSWTDAAEISDLAVDRPLRGRGAGTALVETAAGWARQRSKRALWVEPRANNAPAIEFYVRRGFRVSGFNERLYSNADDAPGRQTLYIHLELS
jgi:ribosomal protein S18 acetylase RimI-like enzyme